MQDQTQHTSVKIKCPHCWELDWFTHDEKLEIGSTYDGYSCRHCDSQEPLEVIECSILSPEKEKEIERIEQVAEENRNNIESAIDTMIDLKEDGWTGHLCLEIDEDDLIVGTDEKAISQFPSGNSWTGNCITIASIENYDDPEELNSDWMTERAKERYDEMVQAKLREIREEDD